MEPELEVPLNRLLVMLIAGILSLLAGIALDGLFLPGVSAQWTTQGYPIVQAKVIECGPPGTAWSLRSVTYEYKVQQKSYRGSLVRHAGCPPPLTPDPTPLLNGLKVGQTFDVRYRPDKPDTSIVLAGLQSSDHAFLLLIAALHLIGVGFILRVVSTRTLANRYPETGGIAYYVRGVATVLDSQPAYPFSSGSLAMGLALLACSLLALKSSYFFVDSPLSIALAVTAAAFVGGLELRKSENNELAIDLGNAKIELPVFNTTRPTIIEILVNWILGPERISVTLLGVQGISHLPLFGQKLKNWAMWSVGVLVKQEDDTLKSLVGLGQSREESEQLAKWLKTKLKFSGQSVKSERN